MSAPSNFLDFADYLAMHTDRLKAVADLLGHASGSLSEQECYRLSVLLNFLTDDLTQNTHSELEVWKDERPLCVKA